MDLCGSWICCSRSGRRCLQSCCGGDGSIETSVSIYILYLIRTDGRYNWGHIFFSFFFINFSQRHVLSYFKLAFLQAGTTHSINSVAWWCRVTPSPPTIVELSKVGSLPVNNETYNLDKLWRCNSWPVDRSSPRLCSSSLPYPSSLLISGHGAGESRNPGEYWSDFASRYCLWSNSDYCIIKNLICGHFFLTASEYQWLNLAYSKWLEPLGWRAEAELQTIILIWIRANV